MTFKELELFFALSENPNVSEVAKEKGLSQSAVSLAIKSLEEDLGEKLFDRIGKKLVLNERGRIFKEKTLNHFLALKDSKEFFKKEKISGNLKIQASKTIGTFIIPQIIFDFLENYPNVKIYKETQNSKEIIKNIKEGKIDIGFIEREIDDKDIIKEKIGEDELIVVSSEKYENEVFIDTLKNKKWLLREEGSGTRDMFLNALGEYKDLNIFMEFSGFLEIKELLKNKDTITCISKYAVIDELKAKKLFEVKLKNFKFKRNFYMIYHKNKYHSKLFDEFRKFVKKEIECIVSKV